MNTFELFGFDFMVHHDGSLVLLEVNEGPAMEAVAHPVSSIALAALTKDTCNINAKQELAEELVEDTLRLVLDPLRGVLPLVLSRKWWETTAKRTKYEIAYIEETIDDAGRGTAAWGSTLHEAMAAMQRKYQRWQDLKATLEGEEVKEEER